MTDHQSKYTRTTERLWLSFCNLIGRTNKVREKGIRQVKTVTRLPCPMLISPSWTDYPFMLSRPYVNPDSLRTPSRLSENLFTLPGTNCVTFFQDSLCVFYITPHSSFFCHYVLQLQFITGSEYRDLIVTSKSDWCIKVSNSVSKKQKMIHKSRKEFIILVLKESLVTSNQSFIQPCMIIPTINVRR